MAVGAAPGERTTADPLDLPPSALGLARGSGAARLRRLGITTVRDLLFHLPRTYHDFSRPLTLRDLREEVPEGPVSAEVEVVDLRVEAGFRRRVQRTVARIRDDTGEGEAIWFGRRYIERRLKPGDRVAVSGKVELRGWLPRFENPEFGPLGERALHAGRIVPVYRLTEGITVAWLRRLVHDALERVAPTLGDYLPQDARRELGEDAPGIADALRATHFPADFVERDRALGRLAFDELLALQVGMVARDRRRRRQHSEPIPIEPDRVADAIANVEAAIGRQVERRLADADAITSGSAGRPEPSGTRLTDDQRTAVEAIAGDLHRNRPMLRLLQGDVGSGKTAVAALALCLVADAGRQGALLAPTDLLARQHAATLGTLLEPLGHQVTLLTASLPAAERRTALDRIARPEQRTVLGRSDGLVVIGTHALVQETVEFADLRLAVVDEQHRFGVAQRAALAAKGNAPHILLMTATPIPRTLGQIFHADLDVSDLRTPPAGRLPIATGVRRPEELLWHEDARGTKRPGALPLIVREVAAGHRAFVVVPLVEDDPSTAARSVEEGVALIRDRWSEARAIAGAGPDSPRVVTVHGQMRPAERDAAMDGFRGGEAHVLVGTTVVEVGVDVPEATVMLILDADRFGLAQLHQLRGRVGRGAVASYCIVVSDAYPDARVPESRMTDEQRTVKARLDAVASTQDGFALAELDLEQRREGELLGLQQSGLPPFRVASVRRREHRDLSVRARRAAERLVDAEGRLVAGTDRFERELTTGWLRRVGAGELLDGGELASAAAEA